MTGRLAAGLGAATAAPSLVVVLVVAGGSRSPERHRDGQGPLGSTGNPGSRISESMPPTAKGPWTFGFELCLFQGRQSAVIQSIGPHVAVGNGYRFLGARMRTFPTTTGNPIGGVVGFPPSLPDKLFDPTGYRVSVACHLSSPGEEYTELLVGWDDGPGHDGGSWLGIDVGYSVGGHHRLVTLGYDLLICGPVAAKFVPQVCKTK